MLTIASAGLLAAVPFWHAAGRLKRRAVRRLAIRYTVADAALFFLGTLAPQRPDGTTADGPFSDVLALGAIAVIVVGCIQLWSLRREVYSGPDGEPASEDPLARALAARTRRQETRELLAKDPALGRELGIGRPDLGKGYDDGGLVDLNTAPASVIAQVCGIDSSYAERIVAARGGPRGYYNNLADLFVDVNLPPSVQQQVQERAVL